MHPVSVGKHLVRFNCAHVRRQDPDDRKVVLVGTVPEGEMFARVVDRKEAQIKEVAVWRTWTPLTTLYRGRAQAMWQAQTVWVTVAQAVQMVLWLIL